MKTKQLCALLFCILTLASCAGSKLLSTWEAESIDKYTLDQLLVVGIAKDETKRRIYEDTFVDSFTASGVNAVASYTVSKQPIEPDEKTLRDVVKKTKANFVLITHLVSANEQDYYQPGRTLGGLNRPGGYGLYGYYPFIYGSVHNSGGYSSTTKVVLESTVYDVVSEKRIWSAQSLSIDPVMTRKYYQQLIDLFLADLKRKNLL
jgi:hypothetical protein